MPKLIYPVWKSPSVEKNDFRDQLLNSLAPKLLSQSAVSRLRITVVDSDVEPASHKRLESCQPLPDATLSVYPDSPGQLSASEKQAIDLAVNASVARSMCYVVEEAEPLPNVAHPVASGGRVYGFCQVVFLQRPPRLSEPQWLDLWQGQHTRIAIDTQATFGYRQNHILDSCSEAASVFHAIVEENFPPGAMTSDQAFYGASEAPQLQANMAAMMESCAKFIDFDKIDVIPMSEYLFRA